MYSRQYQTTAEDRAMRGVRETQCRSSVQGATGSRSQTPPIPPRLHVTIDRIGNNDSMHHENTSHSEYRDLPQVVNSTTRQASYPNTRRNTTNPFLPGYNGNAEDNEAIAAWNVVVPQVEPLPIMNPDRYLTKTDRTVIMEMIRKVPIVEGDDDVMLIDFLRQLRPVFSIIPECSEEIVKLLLPRTKGELFKIWVEAVTSRITWDRLHTAILEHFIPRARVRELELMEIDRPQREGESFARYVDSVIDSAFALKIDRSESDVIDSILARCNPNTKVHFNFFNKPKNILELKMLANKVTGSIKTENRYFGDTVSVAVPQAQSMANNGRTQPSSNYPNNNYNQRGNLYRSNNQDRSKGNHNIKCYKCQKMGHIAKFCKSQGNGRMT